MQWLHIFHETMAPSVVDSSVEIRHRLSSDSEISVLGGWLVSKVDSIASSVQRRVIGLLAVTDRQCALHGQLYYEPFDSNK